jgi:hypothetical protein
MQGIGDWRLKCGAPRCSGGADSEIVSTWSALQGRGNGVTYGSMPKSWGDESIATLPKWSTSAVQFDFKLALHSITDTM